MEENLNKNFFDEKMETTATEMEQPIVDEKNSVDVEAVAATKDPVDEAKKNNDFGHFIFDLVLLAAVIVLFVFHFIGNKQEVAPVVPEGTPRNGDMLFVNIDTINANYELVSIMTDSLEVEKQKQGAIFQKRQKDLESKLANYQRQMQAGQLTAQQAQYAEASLQQESQKLQADYESVMADFESRYATALLQINDSLKAVTERVNKRHNASYVIQYGTGGPIVSADPTKDITKEVLVELNKPYKKRNSK